MACHGVANNRGTEEFEALTFPENGWHYGAKGFKTLTFPEQA